MKQPVKTFTVDEANAAIPFLEASFRSIMECRQRQKLLNRDIQDLHEIWGDQIFEERNMDNKFYTEKIGKRDVLTKLIQKDVERISQHGCLIKDLDNGLVDFYFDRAGELVFLCWRYGEKNITHWHPLDSGFAARRHIDSLKQQEMAGQTGR